MKRAAVVIVALMFVAMVGAVPSPAEGSLTIKPVSDLEQEVVGGETAVFSWFVYNRHAEDLHISASLDIDDPDGALSSSELRITKTDMDVEPGGGVLLRSNGSAHIEAVLDVRELSPGSELTIALNLSIDVGVDDEDIIEERESATLEVIPLYQLHDSYNKILGVLPNFLPAPLDSPEGAFLASMLAWLTLAAFFLMLMLPWLTRKILDRDDQYCPRIRSLLRRPFFLLVLSYGLFSSLMILGLDYTTAMRVATLSTIAYIVLAAWIVWEVYKLLVQRFTERFRDEDGLVDASLGPLFMFIGKLVLGLSVLGAVLDVFGFDLMYFLAGAGILGLAIAFGAQETLNNLFAGFFLLLERPFKVGDLVMMEDGVVCEVKKVGLRSTTLYNTWDPLYFVMPNRHIADSKITNVLRPDPKYWVKINVGVAYGSDIELVKEILLRVAMEHPETMKDEDHLPWSRFMAFGDSALEFRVTAWVPDFEINYRVASELRETIDKEFRKHGVQIPFPQRDIWFRNHD